MDRGCGLGLTAAPSFSTPSPFFHAQGVRGAGPLVLGLDGDGERCRAVACRERPLCCKVADGARTGRRAGTGRNLLSFLGSSFLCFLFLTSARFIFSSSSPILHFHHHHRLSFRLLTLGWELERHTHTKVIPCREVCYWLLGCCYCCCQQFGKLRVRMGKGTQDFSSAMGFPSEDEERRLGKRRAVTSQSVSQLVSLISIWQGKLLHSTTTPTKIYFSPSQAGASPPVLVLIRRGVLLAAPTETGSEGA